MVDLVTIKHKNSLVPATALDLEVLDKVRSGQPLRTSVVFSRSVQHMRWYRAVCAVVADAIGMPPGLLHAELKLKSGMVRNILMSKKAGPVVELEYCAFGTMDETRFTEFTRLAVEIIFRDYLSGVRRSDVFKQVEALVGPRPK